ncbi:helicase HerA-like domain-containing protein, partial [Thiolapillus sp.]
MSEAIRFLIGGNGRKQVHFRADKANRHGMIAGATGTGKTVTLQVLAENFSAIGVPVFMADVKGDLSGLAKPGKAHPKIEERVRTIGMEDFQFRGNPVLFWDLFGKLGHPVRTTISDMGPLLLANLLQLNDTQTGILYAAFSIADDTGMLLLDLKDLRAMLNWMGENRKTLSNEYGNISTASIGAIQRRLLILEEQGADHLFGEPALRLEDLMITDFSGKGVGVYFITQSPLDIPADILGQLGMKVQHALRAFTP